MTQIHFKLILTLLLLISAASPYSYGQSCPANAWCQTYAGGGGSPGDFGWNHLVYVPDNNIFYLYAIAHGGQTPFESAITTYQHQTEQLVSSNPWKTKADCGNGADGSPSSITVCTNAGCTTNSTNSQGSNNPNKDHEILIGNGSGGPLQSTDTSVALTYGSQSGQQLINQANPTFTSTGTLIIDNEAIDYSAMEQGNACGTKPYSGSPACAGAAMSGNCLGSTCSVFTLSARGVRRGAGFGAAASHLGGGLSAGADVHQACSNPQIDMGDGLGLRSTLTAISGGGDNPAVRHVARNYSYSRLNHRIMMVGGYHENFEFTDTWFLCLSVGGACTQDLVNGGWQLMITPHNIGKRQETQTAYDDTANAFVEFGGLQDPGGQSTPSLWVNCPVVNTAAGCTAANDWFSVTNTTCNGPDCTSNHMPPWRHGAQMRYMPDSGQIIMFGGFGTGGPGGSNQPLADIWIYNANTRTWTEGTTFPGSVGDSNFSPTAWPAFAYDTARHLAVLDAGPGSVYAYNPVADSWNSIAVPGGPQLDTVDQGEPSRTLEYDSADDVYVFVQQGGLNGVSGGNADTWELSATVVPQQGFGMTISPSSASIKAGQSANQTITLRPWEPLAGSISLSCSGLPSLATCSFVPATITLGSSPINSVLTVSTSGPNAVGLRHLAPTPNTPMFAFLVSGLGFGLLAACVGGKSTRVRTAASVWLLIVALGLAGLQSACGGGSSNGGAGGGSGGGGGAAAGGTPPGIYNVIVTGTSGSVQQITTLTLTVN